ncbi:MAG: MarR family winged helix-turn-helix transcriptional regulator [Gemmatimonadaceae bacterium]
MSVRTDQLESPDHETFALVQRTASELDQQLAQTLRPVGLTTAKFNVLRLLRRAGGAGLACSELSERLIRHDPDVTRLLDRLEARKFVTRSRDAADRRVVMARITETGLRVLEKLDAPVAALHRRQLSALRAEQRRELVSLLGVIRARSE